jgi:hypothetical protein
MATRSVLTPSVKRSVNELWEDKQKLLRFGRDHFVYLYTLRKIARSHVIGRSNIHRATTFEGLLERKDNTDTSVKLTMTGLGRVSELHFSEHKDLSRKGLEALAAQIITAYDDARFKLQELKVQQWNNMKDFGDKDDDQNRQAIRDMLRAWNTLQDSFTEQKSKLVVDTRLDPDQTQEAPMPSDSRDVEAFEKEIEAAGGEKQLLKKWSSVEYAEPMLQNGAHYTVLEQVVKVLNAQEIDERLSKLKHTGVEYTYIPPVVEEEEPQVKPQRVQKRVFKTKASATA